MDWKVQQPTQNEIEQFLRDVRAHFRASLETSEYENTSNIFHVTEAETTLKLLLRCELLLEHYTTEKQKQTQQHKNHQPQQQQQNAQIKNIGQQVNNVNGVNGQQPLKPLINCTDNRNTTTAAATTILNHKLDDVSYLDMSGGSTKKPLNWYDDMNECAKSDKTFRCSTRFGSQSNGLYNADDSDNNGNNHGDNDDDDDDDEDDDDDDNDSNDDANSQGYDICQVSHSHNADKQKAITSELEPMQTVNCPYMDLPAGHLAIEKSTKYGQLQRVEKRLFFDQCKKYYCGVLNDWLLCYADGPTAAHPSITLHLKQSGIEIEHYGEGKRRELCFQITTADPNKKFLFQAINEVDAKEWIVAVETAIRGDNAPMLNKHSRKLPTPPLVKRLTFVSGHSASALPTNGNDCIYEEPSPLYQPEIGGPSRTNSSNAFTLKPPDLPEKCTYPLTAANRYEYDIPKCPPQPIKAAAPTTTDAVPTESETAGLLIGTTENATQANSNKSAAALIVEKIEFQSIVKDVHSKLSSQLSAGANPDRLKKAAKKTYSGSSSDAEAMALTQTSSPAKEHKKQRKSNTPNASPQKNPSNSSNGLNNNSNSNSSNSNSNSERTAVKSWFFNRLNKTTSSTRSSSSAVTPISKCKQSEKENLLNSLEMYDTLDGGVSDFQHNNSNNSNSSNPASPILKMAPSEQSNGKSKVNLIIKEFEANGHLGMFNLETLAGSAVASLSSYCDSDCNNYEPIMTISTPPSSFMKKV